MHSHALHGFDDRVGNCQANNDPQEGVCCHKKNTERSPSPMLQTTVKVPSTKRPGKFFYLFLSQILALVLFPYLDQPGLPLAFFRLLGAVVLVSGVYAVSDKRAHWITALSFAVPAGVLNTIYAIRPAPQLAVLMLIFTLLFIVFILVSLLSVVVRAERVTRDTIYGAFSVYLLMASAWGAAYLLLETVQPGGIAMDAARHPNH